MAQLQNACLRHTPVAIEHQLPSAPHLKGDRFANPYPPCTFDMNKYINTIYPASSPKPPTAPQRKFARWYRPVLSATQLHGRIFKNNKWRKTLHERSVAEEVKIKIDEYVVETAPWIVGRPPSATDLALPVFSQRCSETVLNASLVEATNTTAPQGPIATVASSSRPFSYPQSPVSPVDQHSMPPIETIDQEMIDQTVIESSSGSLDGSTHTTINHVQPPPEQSLANVQSPMEDVLTGSAGCDSPTTPRPTTEVRDSTSQRTQEQLPQQTHLERPLPEIQRAFYNNCRNNIPLTSVYALPMSMETQRQTSEYHASNSMPLDHNMSQEDRITVVQCPEVIQPTVHQDIYTAHPEEDTEMTTDEIQSNPLDFHAEDDPEIRPTQTSELQSPVLSRDIPTAMAMPQSSSGLQTSYSSALLARPQASGSRATLPLRNIDEDGDTPEILRRQRQRQGRAKPYDSLRRPDKFRQSEPPEEQHRDMSRLHRASSTMALSPGLGRRHRAPSRSLAHFTPRQFVEPPSEPPAADGTWQDRMHSRARTHIPARGELGRREARNSSPRDPRPNRPNPLEDLATRLGLNTIAEGPQERLNMGVSSSLVTRHPMVHTHTPARRELGYRRALPTNMECFGIRVSKPRNSPTRDPRPYRPDPLEGLATRLGLNTIAENSRGRSNVGLLSSSPITQRLPPTSSYDRSESVTSPSSLRRRLDAQRIHQWNLVYNPEFAVNSEATGQTGGNATPNHIPGPSGTMPTVEDHLDYEAVNEQSGSPTTPDPTHDMLMSDDDSEDVGESPLETGNRDNPLITIAPGDRNSGDVPPISSTILGEVDAFLDELSFELQAH